MEKITSIELLEKLKSYKGFGIGLHGIDEERYKRVIACMENETVSMSTYDELRRLKTQ